MFIKLKKLIWETLFLIPKPIAKWFFGSKWIWRKFNGGFFAINDLDKKLVAYLPQTPGFYLEIGGNDGLSQSNTKHFEMYKGWKGILVEPFEINYRRIEITRSSGTTAIHGACVPLDFKDEFLILTYGDLMTVSSGLKTTLENPSKHIEESRNYIRAGKPAVSFKAPALKLNEILKANRAPSVIDFFSLDVEGAELSVLQGVNHSEFRFKWLLVETGQFEIVENFLSSQGYSFVDSLSGHDYLFQDLSTGD